MLRAIERSESTVDVQPPDAAFYGTLPERAEMDLADSDGDMEVLEPGAAVQFVDLSSKEAEAPARLGRRRGRYRHGAPACEAGNVAHVGRSAVAV